MKILIVDDQPMMARSFGRWLTRLGHEPVLCGDAVEALDAVGEGIDAVITNLDVPALDGVAVAQLLHRRRPQLPIGCYTVGGDDDVSLWPSIHPGPVTTQPWNSAAIYDLLAALAGRRPDLNPCLAAELAPSFAPAFERAVALAA